MSDTVDFTSDVGFPPKVAECLEKKRAYVRGAPLQELRAALEASDSPAKSCGDDTLCRFLESNVTVKNLEIKGVSIKATAKCVSRSRSHVFSDHRPASF